MSGSERRSSSCYAIRFADALRVLPWGPFVAIALMLLSLVAFPQHDHRKSVRPVPSLECAVAIEVTVNSTSIIAVQCQRVPCWIYVHEFMVQYPQDDDLFSRVVIHAIFLRSALRSR